MKIFKIFYRPNQWRVTGYFPHESFIWDPILIQEKSPSDPEREHDYAFLHFMWKDFLNEAESLGCRIEDGVVIQITRKKDPNIPLVNDSVLYLGLHEGRIMLGLSVYQKGGSNAGNRYFP